MSRQGIGALIVVGLVLAACGAPAPASQSAASASPSVRVAAAATATPRPEAAAAPLGLLVTRMEVDALPPAEPTPENQAIGRPTPTPGATADTAWKYLSLTLAVENRSDAARLVGISGSQPNSTNLAEAVLTAGGSR